MKKKYVVAIIVAFLLNPFFVGLALLRRGYFGYGGEYIAPAMIILFPYICEVMYLEIKRIIKARKRDKLIRRITVEQYLKLKDEKGLFYFTQVLQKGKKLYIAIDSTGPESYVEEFETSNECRSWLRDNFKLITSREG